MSVVIVGGGPVGLTVSIALSELGITNVVIERDETVYGLPRAIVMDAEARYSLTRLGLGSRLERILEPMVAADFVDAEHKRLMGVDLVGLESLGCPVVSKHFQPMLDACLREAAIERGARLILGRSVIEIENRDDAVTASLDDGTRIEGLYLVGSDGASSSVRKMSGITLCDLGFDQDWLVVDIELDDRQKSGLPDVTRQVCDARRPTTLVSGFGNYYRFEFQLQPGEEREAVVEESSVWRLLQPWISESQARLVRRAAYRFHAVVAEAMNTGRVLLAGDSAHQMPPFMGQGLNCGMRDAFNLAWKLRYVLAQWSGSKLLDTYSSERIPLARHVVEQSVETGRLVDQLAGRESNEVSRHAGYGGRRLPGRYEEGVVVGDDPLVGTLYPYWHQLKNASVDEFSLLAGKPSNTASLGPVPIREVVTAESSRLGHDHIVVRPDGYVAAVCRHDEVVRVLQALKSRLYVAGGMP